MSEKLIRQAKNNKERQETYQYQLGRYKLAMKNEFYFEGLIIVYAMLEDRMRSFLYYCGLFANRNTLKVYGKVKEDIQKIVFDELSNKIPSMRTISTKILYIKRLLGWADSIMAEEIMCNDYLTSLKSQLESVDIGGMLEVLEELSRPDSGWLAYRNEIIHATMNKNLNALNENLGGQVEKGMEYARFIDSQVHILRTKGRVRKCLNLQNN